VAIKIQKIKADQVHSESSARLFNHLRSVMWSSFLFIARQSRGEEKHFLMSDISVFNGFIG
jgi:hypothetical protein